MRIALFLCLACVGGPGAAQSGRVVQERWRGEMQPRGDALLRDTDSAFHFAGALSVDHYQGREQVQFRLTDMAKPKV